MSAVKDLTALLAKLKADIEANDKAGSDLRATYEEIEKSLFMEMGSEGMSSARFEDLGYQVVAVRRQFPRVNPDMKYREEEIFDFLRSHGHGDVVRLSVNSQTMKSTLKQIIGEGVALPDLFEIYEEVGVTLRKA